MKTSLKKAAAVICIMAVMGVKGPVSANAEDQSEPLNGVSVFNGHTYKAFNDSKTWTEAKNYCESIG